jgi:uncharacterized protein (TIRG00374 family)
VSSLSDQAGRPAGDSSPPVFRVLRYLVIVIVLGFLLWWSFRTVKFSDIADAFRLLRWEQIALLLLLNVLAISLITARWWLIVQASDPTIPFLPLVSYRLAVFGFSYITPGPQVGGEPLQVVYLQRNYHMTYAQATSTVIMDKLVEFLVNFLMLSVGIWAVTEVGLLQDQDDLSIFALIPLGLLLIWPLIHILLLYHQNLPLTWILKKIPGVNLRSKPVRLAIVSERMAAKFCRQNSRALMYSIGVSILSVLVIMLEYGLMARYLGVNFSLLEIFAALTFLQLAFLVPLPGGLGAMEASQVFVFSFLGTSNAVAISLTLLQRARDILNGGVGLLLAGQNIAKFRNKGSK